jgi:mediator of RNA polymerase II transcription subunit 5
MATITEQWTSFLDRCLERRVRSQQFHSLVAQLHRRTPIFSPKLAEILITRQARMGGMLDPLLPVYAEALLERGRISSADLLGALYKHSKANAKTDTLKAVATSLPEGKFYNSAEFESITFEVLTRAYLPEGGQPQTQDETRVSLVLLTEWLNANVTRGTSLADEPDHQTLIDAMAVFESFGALSTAMLENARVAGVIDVMLSREVKKKLAQALTSFVQFWSTAAPQHAQSVARLDLAQKTRALVDAPTVASHDAALDVAAAMQIDSVVDMQTIHTRPHVFVFINALLTGCPLTDESLMMSYLHTRHGGNAQSLAIELIYASFDTLAAAAERNESQYAMFTLKSFLIHKVPLLLTTLAGALIAPELVIQQALSHIDLNVFPTVGLGMLQSNTALQDTRQDFVYTCILHGLLATDSVGRLLGESTFDSPPSPSSRLHKDVLVQQCATEAGKVVQLVARLEKLDGNAGAIVGAVVESIRTACVTKDTMSLRSICNAFAGKPAFLDIILMFVSPASLLQPLCQLLDTWKYEDDQGESQPVYDEFSAVFLLVLAFIYRYEFSPAEVGINKDSFIARYLAHDHQEQLQSQLSDEQSRHLAGWIKGLLDSDGIPEEVTSSCQPQQFYMLVPTIISQTILACSAGILGIDAIGNGLECNLSHPSKTLHR